MKIILFRSIIVYFCLALLPAAAHAQKGDYSFLKKEVNLAANRSSETQFYIMTSECINYALDGKRLNRDIFKLYLKWVPSDIAGKTGDEFTCIKFTVQLGDASEVAIPALANWRHFYSAGIDEKNQVFGIDHSKFDVLTDSNGNDIPTDKAYHVYNTFIDFHAFCNVFPERTMEGKGIQDLTKIGQKIIHAAAFTEPPTHLGKNILDGSFFKNGEITLEFKGLGVVNDRPCALLNIDSGESSFKMIVKPMADLTVVAVGSSHYKGDIYKNLTSNWVEKVAFDEMVVTEATMPIPPNKVNSVVERQVVIVNVNEDEMARF